MIIQWAIIMILACICIGLWIRLILFKNEARSLQRQIEFIQENATNTLLTNQIGTQEIVELTRSCNELIKRYSDERILSLRREKKIRQVITNVAHDLRTPLTSAKGYIQMVCSNKVTDIQKQEYLVIIEKRLDFLQHMLQQLFEFARIEADEYELDFERVNIGELLCDTLAMYYEEFKEKHIEPSVNLEEEESFVICDKRAMQRVFQNLVMNSLKYGKDHIKIEVKNICGDVVIILSNGIEHMTQEESEQIFDRFYTVDKSRTQKSTGLGLAIVKSLVGKMNASIQATLAVDDLEIIIKIRACA